MPCHLKEGFTPPSGIDTITIWIRPDIITRSDMFHEYGNINQTVNLRFKKQVDPRTKAIYGTDFFIDIQAEAVDPNYDIKEQVVSILSSMAYDGIIHYPQMDNYINSLRDFFYYNFDRFFALQNLDFYFDLRDEDMHLLGESNPAYPNTRYSLHYPPVLKAYNRREKLKQKKHIPYEEIENMDYPARIEFSLCRDNCDYLNMHNLNGSYENVFLQYLPFLARKWRDNRYEVVKVEERNITYDHHLRQVITVAGQRIPHYTLYSTPLKPIPNKQVKK
jgi:hypothetical protein